MADQYLLQSKQFSLKITEGKRLFSLIQQNVEESKSVLTAATLQSFLKKYNPFSSANVKAIEILHSLDSTGEEMNQQNFSIFLARVLKSENLSNEASLSNYLIKVKDVLQKSYSQSLQKVDKWDIQGQQELTQQFVQQKKANISQFYSQLQPYAESMQNFTFQNSLDRINYCLSIISMTTNEQDIIRVFQAFINSTIMMNLSNFVYSLSAKISNGESILNQQTVDHLLKYFKFISYLHGVMRIKQMREKLESSSCLVYHETMAALVQSLELGDSSVKKQVAIAICLASKYVRKFNEWVLCDVANNLNNLCRLIAGLSESDGLQYALQCLQNVLKQYKNRPQNFQEQEKHLLVLGKIFLYSLTTLKLSSIINNQAKCLIIISQIVQSAYEFSNSELENLKIINIVFQSGNNALISATLRILEVAIVKNKTSIKNMIIQNDGFLTCLSGCLQNSENQMFLEFLHILELLSVDNLHYLLEKDILKKILSLISQPHHSTVTATMSLIIFNIAQQAVDSQSCLDKIYQTYNLIDILAVFLKKAFQNDQTIQYFMIIQQQQQGQNSENKLENYSYFNKLIFHNVCKTMYCLAMGISRRHKKNAFSKKINLHLIQSILDAFKEFFSFNSHLITLVLRQKLQILNCKQIKLENGIELYRLLNMVFEQMTYNMQGRDIQLLKRIQNLKKTYCNNLCYFFKTHELEVDNIPIFISIAFTIGQTYLKRDVPHKYDLSSLKTYLKDFIARQLEYNQSSIKDVIIRQQNNDRLIQNDVQYRTLINKSIENKEFELKIEVVDLKLKPNKEELSSSFMSVIPPTGTDRSVYLPNRQSSSFFNQNKFATQRFQYRQGRMMNDLKGDSSNYPARINTYSPLNPTYSYRPGNQSHSPAFGNKCKKCGLRTLNREFCNNCQNNLS